MDVVSALLFRAGTRVVRTGTALGLAVALTPLASAAQLSVGRNVQVSAARAGEAHLEPMVAADPKNANRLIAGSHIHHLDTPRTYSIAYASFDGGKTWQLSLERRDSTSGVDVALAYGPDGSAFFVTLAPGRSAFRSRDGGRTWDDPTKIPLSRGFWNSPADRFPGLDRPYLAADFTGGKYHGRVYMNGTVFPEPIDSGFPASGLGLFTSIDGGTTFGTPSFKAVFLPEIVVGMGNCVVLSDGTVISLFGVMKRVGYTGADTMTGPSGSLRVLSSTDAGTTLGYSVKVADFYMNASRSSGAILPTLAVDPGSPLFKDRLYAVWTDFRSKRLEILLSYSSDKGKSWSPPTIINDDRVALDPAKGPDNITPNVAVNNSGVVGVSWYDRRDAADNLGWTVRFRASTDGGDTWTSSVKVSDTPTVFGKNESWNATGGSTSAVGDTGKSGGKVYSLAARVENFHFSPGHLSGLAAAADGTFHVLWIDNRTGVAQIWTAPVTVQATVARNGGGDLAKMRDLSGRLSIEVASSGYDRSTNRLTFRVRLKNLTKTDTVRGPVKARVLAVRSEVAIAEIANADNSVRGPGAVFDLTSLLPSGRLLPDSLSAAKEIVLQLSDIRPFRQGNRTKLGLATFEARVLGPPDAKASARTAGDKK